MVHFGPQRYCFSLSGGESHGESDLHDAVVTAVVNKRAGGMGLILSLIHIYTIIYDLAYHTLHLSGFAFYAAFGIVQKQTPLYGKLARDGWEWTFYRK